MAARRSDRRDPAKISRCSCSQRLASLRRRESASSDARDAVLVGGQQRLLAHQRDLLAQALELGVRPARAAASRRHARRAATSMTSSCCSRLRRSSSSVSSARSRSLQFRSWLVELLAALALGMPTIDLAMSARARPAACRCSQAIWRTSPMLRRRWRPTACSMPTISRRFAFDRVWLRRARRGDRYALAAAPRNRRCCWRRRRRVDGVAKALVARQRPQVQALDAGADQPEARD